MIHELRTESRIAALDGLRGIAVLLVFFSHTSGRGMNLIPQLNFHGIGHIGVYLFFVLSSFLLSVALLKIDFTLKNILRFYVKRAFRIIPLYYLLVTVIFLIEKGVGDMSTNYLHIGDFRSLMLHYSFYQGNSVFWSIVIEMQFYVVVPLIILLLRIIPRLTILGLVFIMGINSLLYTCELIGWPVHLDYIKWVTPNAHGKGTYIDIFICGILVAYLYVNHNNWLSRNKIKLTASSSILFFLLLACTILLVSEKIFSIEQPLRDLRYMSVLYGAIFSLFLLSLCFESKVRKALSWKPLRFIGIIGFSFYLFHMAVFQFLNLFELNSSIKFILALILTSTISTLSFVTIERWSIGFAKKINKYIE